MFICKLPQIIKKKKQLGYKNIHTYIEELHFRIMCWGDAGRKRDIQYRLLRELTSRQSKTWRAPSKYLYCSSGLQTCSLAMENWEKQGNSEWPWQTPVLSAESQWFNLLSSPQLRIGHDVVQEGSSWLWAAAAAGCWPQHLGARPHRGSAPCSC